MYPIEFMTIEEILWFAIHIAVIFVKGPLKKKWWNDQNFQSESFWFFYHKASYNVAVKLSFYFGSIIIKLFKQYGDQIILDIALSQDITWQGLSFQFYGKCSKEMTSTAIQSGSIAIYGSTTISMSARHFNFIPSHWTLLPRSTVWKSKRSCGLQLKLPFLL